MFAIGQYIGHYEILEKLGEGGMGIVYKARDTHLNRFVALKLLLPEKLGHENQPRRFAMEARAASMLNHPNIITVHNISSEDDNAFIVMEYVRGKALNQIIPRRGMRLNEVLNIAIQIADALAAAAAGGIVHRDLKPSNVMIADSGLVKVVDFGLAKLVERSVSDEMFTTLDDHEGPLTREGTVLGTVSYMSPEQAEGKLLDARSDIFSFGALLYEMVTGQRAFRGDTSISIISAILRDEPKPAREIRSNVPRDLEKVVNRCLRKDPNRRFQNIADVRIALLELKEESDLGKLPVRSGPPKITGRSWAALGCVVAAIGIAVAVWFYKSSASPQPEALVTPLTNYSGVQGYPAFSPDGNQIAFAWTGARGTTMHIYVKIIGTDLPLQLTSSRFSDTHPAWAPDGKSIAFIRALSPTATGIYEIAPLGGREREIAEVGAAPYQALSWSHDGKALLTSGHQGTEKRSRIFTISAENGELRPLSLGSVGDEFYPALSLTSQLLAFSRRLSDVDWGIFVVPMNSRLQPDGPPHRLNTPFGLNRQSAWTEDGREIVFANGVGSNMHLWRVSAHGDSPAREVPFTGGIIYEPAIAASGKRLAYVHESGITNIWRAAVTPNGKAGPPIQNASARASIVRPNAFSPDGQQMAFESDRSGPYGIWIANTDGSNAKFLFGSFVYPSGSPVWSSDGRWIAFDTKIDKQAAIYVISATGSAPRRLTHSRADDMVPCWSRNGKWIYFVSDRTGSFEIFKISPEGGEEIQITHAGGFGPQESSDGKFLFYTRTRATSSPLLKMSAQGGPEAQILPSVHDRWWAVSDQGIWFMESTYNGSDPGFFEQENAVTDRGDLRFLNFESGAVTLASTIPKRPAGGIAISRDQRTLVFGQVDYRPTEIVLVENFR